MACDGWRWGAVAVALCVCGTARAGSYLSLDAALEPYRAQYGLPALAAAIARDGTVVAAGAVGTRRAGSEIAVTVQDRFHLGSDTEAMTALLAAMLVEEGTLGWDSTVGEIFPELAGRMDDGVRGVTLVQLLSHTSGIASDNEAFGDLLVTSQMRDGNLDELRYGLLRDWSTQRLAATPGTAFAYATMNYVIVGAIIERISGRTWDELITERVFVPLDLTSAGLGAQASLGRTDAPLGHAVVDGAPKAYLAGPSGDEPPVIGPAGIAHMSVLDFARWAAWNAGQGKRGPGLVQPATLQRLHARVASVPPRPDAPPGTPLGGWYGLGWGELAVDWAPAPLLHHAGSNGKNVAHIWVEPSRDLALVLMTNIGGQRADDGLRAAAAELYARFAAAEVPSGSTVEPTPGETGQGSGGLFGAPKPGKAPFAGDTRRGKGL